MFSLHTIASTMLGPGGSVVRKTSEQAQGVAHHFSRPAPRAPGPAPISAPARRLAAGSAQLGLTSLLQHPRHALQVPALLLPEAAPLSAGEPGSVNMSLGYAFIRCVRHRR